MQLTLFPNDDQINNNPQKHIEVQDATQATLIKVRPKDYVYEQDIKTQQQPDLIFAFEDFEQDKQKQYYEQKLKEQSQGTIQTIIEQTKQANNSLRQQKISVDTFPHKNLFVIERILFFPQKFYLYDSNNNFLLCARKKLIQINSMYYFFNDINMQSTKNQNYLGYMTSSSQYKYTLYSINDTPLAQFKYTTKKKAPSQINIHIMNKQPTHKQQKLNQDVRSIFKLHNRMPTKNLETGKYSTCLEGLGKVASAKNCAILNKQQSSLIMGKIKQKHYNLHYGDPWTHFIAFAFAISNYEEKDFQQ